MFAEYFSDLMVLVNHPVTRLLQLLITGVALYISWKSLRRTSDKAELDTARHLESQWQAIYHLTFREPSFAKYVSQMFDFGGDPEEARKGTALQMYINVLATVHDAYSRKLLSKPIYDSHMKSFFYCYIGDTAELDEAIGLEGYDEKFINECRRWTMAGVMHRKHSLPTGQRAPASV